MKFFSANFFQVINNTQNLNLSGEVPVERKANNLVVRKNNYRHYRRPFWLPAPAYYILTLAVAIAIFFLLWGILHEGEDMPWVFAGVSAAAIIFAAVILREFFLRKSRNRFLLAEKRLDDNLAALSELNHRNANKFTLEKNSAFLKDIERKSEAAKILEQLPEAHFEVFEMCNKYLSVTEFELPLIAPGSPRLAAIRLGREKVKQIHKQHLFKWAEIESKSFTQEAQIRATMSEKIESAHKAKAVFDRALKYYPNETKFFESVSAIDELIVSIKVSHWIEEAERAAFKGNLKDAIEHYQDALFYLNKENIGNEQREFITEKINEELKKLQELSSAKTTKRIKQNSKKK